MRATYCPQMTSVCERINNPAKLIQCCQMHNEEEFVYPVLSSIYNEVDQIIVIEGAVKNRPNATEDGHSTDKTIELIQQFIAEEDKDKKITFISIKRPWENLEEIKQTFLDVCTPGDWIIISDADEIYRSADIRRVRKAIDLYPHATEFIPLFLHFYKDFLHITAPAPDWQPQHQRVFKVQRGMKYHSHPIVTDADGACTYFSPHYQHRRYVMNDFYIYHYGYARSNMREVMAAKKEYYDKELKRLGANKEFEDKCQEFLDNKESEDRLLRFTGTHPKVMMENHPMAKIFDSTLMNRRFKNWTEHPLYQAALGGQEYGNIWLCQTKQSQPYMDHYHNGIIVEE